MPGAKSREHRRQPERLGRGDRARDHPQRHGRQPPLGERVAADPGVVAPGEREVVLVALAPGPCLVRGEQLGEESVGVRRGEREVPGRRAQGAVDPEHRRQSDGEQQVGAADLPQEGEQPVDPAADAVDRLVCMLRAPRVDGVGGIETGRRAAPVGAALLMRIRRRCSRSASPPRRRAERSIARVPKATYFGVEWRNLPVPVVRSVMADGYLARSRRSRPRPRCRRWRPRVLQAEASPRSVIAATEKTTIPARTPRMTMTMRSSIRVKPPSFLRALVSTFCSMKFPFVEG